MNYLSLIGRDAEIFTQDINSHSSNLKQVVSDSRFLVIGAAGSIGQAVTREIFKRNPKVLHVVDISENNMVELFDWYKKDLLKPLIEKNYALSEAAEVLEKILARGAKGKIILKP